MQNGIYLKYLALNIATFTVLLTPTSLIAGGYGSAGVSDAPVSQYAAEGTVWCPRLEANVPGKLYQQMDCGLAENGIARSAVAGERVTNRPRVLRGFFRNFRHDRGRPVATDDDSPASGAVIARDDTSRPTPAPKPTPNSSSDKWDRLNELGVSSDNFASQSKEFKEQVRDYRSTHGADGDWSGFNPD